MGLGTGIAYGWDCLGGTGRAGSMGAATANRSRRCNRRRAELMARIHKRTNRSQPTRTSMKARRTTGCFYTLPNFLTLETAKQVPPLTAEAEVLQSWRGRRSTIVEFPWYGFLAGISQAENSEPGYGQGAAGYGKALRDGFRGRHH